MSAPVQPRNPGPSWGYRFLRGCDRCLPEPVFKPLRALGTWISLAAMPRQRRHSREYLQLVLGRRPHVLDTFRHFFAFEESLMLKLRIANGRPHHTEIADDSPQFREFVRSGEAGLLGTFHVGHSDIFGFLIGPRENHRVYMVRQRVGNSHETDTLGRLFSKWLTFIWVNEPENLLFALKDAIASGGSVAMKCDRVEFSAKTEAFEFLGARRIFPFTIYHLALIFKKPVLLSLGLPDGRGGSVLHGPPRWDPNPERSRAENLESARTHFQNFLQFVEQVLRKHPYLWFNFMEMNPIAPETSAQSPSPSPVARIRPFAPTR
jgi:predicted LPLAT superfamily acyltransferase